MQKVLFSSVIVTSCFVLSKACAAVLSEAWAKLRDWASVAGRGRLLLSGSVAHASLKTAVCINCPPQISYFLCYFCNTAVLREGWATLPESSSWPLPATLAQSRNLAHASLETAVPANALTFLTCLL